jgi:hypothetical protein
MIGGLLYLAKVVFKVSDNGIDLCNGYFHDI